VIIEPKEKNLWAYLDEDEKQWLLNTKYEVTIKEHISPTWEDLKGKPRLTGLVIYLPNGDVIKKLNKELPKSTNSMTNRELFVIAQELSLNYYRKAIGK